MTVIRTYYDSPFRFAVTEDGVTWCYNPVDGVHIRFDTDKIVSWEKVPAEVRRALGTLA